VAKLLPLLLQIYPGPRLRPVQRRRLVPAPPWPLVFGLAASWPAPKWEAVLAEVQVEALTRVAARWALVAVGPHLLAAVGPGRNGN